jgi:hypothetical protein
MSTILCAHPLSTHSNDQHLYTFDYHQQMMIENTNQLQQPTTSSHFNEDDHCQICGDLASGWHCG